jgi:tetratricopeptide (TPR) repeat protein
LADPTNAGLYAERIHWLKRVGNLEVVVADQTSLIGLEPGHADHYVNRADILTQLARFDAVFADYAAAIEFAPHDLKIRRRRGQLYAEHGDLTPFPISAQRWKFTSEAVVSATTGAFEIYMHWNTSPVSLVIVRHTG